MYLCGDASFAELRKKSVRTWSAEEVKRVMKVFHEFDADKSGWIEESEMGALCETMGIAPPSLEQTDKLVKDGKVDTREFFMFYTGCSNLC